MAPAPMARPPRNHLVRFVITRLLFAKRIEPGANRRQSAQCTVSVEWREARPLRRHIVFCEDGLNRTLGNTRITIDTRLGVDHEHVVVEMKSLNGTDKRAVSVTTVNARFSHDVGHFETLAPRGLMHFQLRILTTNDTKTQTHDEA